MTGRRASPLQLTGLQPQPSIRTLSCPLPGAPPLDSLAVRHEERGGEAAEPSAEADTFLTRDGDPNFSPPSLAAERGAVLTLSRPRGCPRPRRRPPCLGAASPAHRRRRRNLLNAPCPQPSLPVQIRGQGVCVQGNPFPAQHHPVPCSPSFPHLSIMLSPPRHPSPPQHPRHEGAPLPVPARRPRAPPLAPAVRGGEGRLRGAASPAPSPSWRASPVTRH